MLQVLQLKKLKEVFIYHMIATLTTLLVLDLINLEGSYLERSDNY
jgi:hypothetical protein